MALTHRWTLDGNANDSVGSNNGTVVGSPSTQAGHPAPNATTNSYGFANNTANRITVTDAAALEPSNISINVWVNPQSNTTPTTQLYVSKWWDGTNRAYELGWDSTLGFYFDVAGASSNTDHIAKDGTTSPTTGSWYMVTGTFDGSTVKVYVNAVVGGTTAALSDTVRTNSADLIFGAEPRNPSVTSIFTSPANAYISDVRMYDNALSQSDINALYVAVGPAIKTLNGTAIASVKSINGTLTGSVKTFNGA